MMASLLPFGTGTLSTTGAVRVNEELSCGAMMRVAQHVVHWQGVWKIISCASAV